MGLLRPCRAVIFVVFGKGLLPMGYHLSVIALICFTSHTSGLFANDGYSAGSSSRETLIETTEMRMFFDSSAGGVSVETLAAEGAEGWVVANGRTVPLWRSGWKDLNGKYHEVAANAVDASPEMTGERNRAHIRWTFALEHEGDTLVTVSVVADDEQTLRWRMQVESQAAGWRLNDVDFPIIGGVSPESARLVQPHGWGLLREDLLERQIWCNYPGVFASMQLVGLQTGDGLLYLSTEDPQAYQKIFGCIPNQSNETLDLRVRHFPSWDPAGKRRWETPYATALAVIPGATWVEAANRYKKWTYSAPWGRCRLEYGFVPTWLAENDLWICHEDGAVDATNIDRLLACKEKFGVRTAVHWYRWHEIPHDVGYPEYFPAKAGSFEAFKRVQEAGLPVMPYINGRLWDPGTESWKVQSASAAATRVENGNVRTEVYYTKIPLAVMCPSTELWQETVTGLVRRLVKDVNVDAVYIDQIGAADAVICHATDHPHPPGGGNYWARGYREMLSRCRDELRLNQAITTEECSDPWNDLIDGFLLVNTHNGLGEIIPLYPMVYGGRTVYFGFQYIAQSEIDEGTPLRAKLARSFVWGGQLGWIRPVIVEERYASAAAFLRELARVRRGAHSYLQYGRMLPSPSISGADIVSVTAYGANGFHTDRMPGVVSGLWRANSGQVGLALCNWTDTDREIEIVGLPYAKPPILIATGDFPSPRKMGAVWQAKVPAGRAVVMVWD
jgi:hypothetical protein